MLTVRTDSSCVYPYFNSSYPRNASSVDVGNRDALNSLYCTKTYSELLGPAFFPITMVFLVIFACYFLIFSYRLLFLYFYYHPLKCKCWCKHEEHSSSTEVIHENSRMHSTTDANASRPVAPSQPLPAPQKKKKVSVAPVLNISIIGWITSLLYTIDHIDLFGARGVLPFLYSIASTRICNFLLDLNRIFIVIQVVDFLIRCANFAEKKGLPRSEWILSLSLTFFIQIVITILSFLPNLFDIFDLIRKFLLVVLEIFIWIRLYIKVHDIIKFLNSMKERSTTPESENKASTTLRTKFNRLQIAFLVAVVFNIVTLVTSLVSISSKKGDYSYYMPPPSFYYYTICLFQDLFQVFILQSMILVISMPKSAKSSIATSHHPPHHKDNHGSKVVDAIVTRPESARINRESRKIT